MGFDERAREKLIRGRDHMRLFKKQSNVRSERSKQVKVSPIEIRPEGQDPSKAAPNDPKEAAQFKDLLLPLMLLLLAMLTVSWYVASGYSREVKAARRNVAELSEQEATLEERIEVAERIQRLDALDNAAPHPKDVVKDQSFIGGHASVAWEYPGGAASNTLEYEIELYRNQVSGGPPRDCPQSEIGSSEESFWNGCPGPIHFVATDPDSMSSRIPADMTKTLSPGIYSWRVAPIGSNLRLHSTEPLHWSAFGLFTVDRSILDRIRRTNRIRVGTNFAQDSPFSRLGAEGEELGFDIELIRTLIEGCLRLSKEGVVYDPKGCSHYIEDPPVLKQYCSENNLCVQFVPIGKWGDWKTRLSSKDIELFVGGITKADARERKGINFSSGYLTYKSQLYIRPEQTNQKITLDTWTSIPRTIGVIAESTNETFLDTFITSSKRALSKVSVSSFPELEKALDSGRVDGIIIDETFVSKDDKWVTVEIPDTSRWWQEYINGYISRDTKSRTAAREQVAIATVWDMPRSDNSLLNALNHALTNPALRRFLARKCRAAWNNPDICDLSFPSR